MRARCDDVSLIIDLSILGQTQGSGIISIIYWQCGDCCFPQFKWSDFVVVILSWWMESVRDMEQPTKLYFMDGPFFMELHPAEAGRAHLDCYESNGIGENDRRLIGCYNIPIARFKREIMAAARLVVTTVEERGWKSKDIERLKALL